MRPELNIRMKKEDTIALLAREIINVIKNNDGKINIALAGGNTPEELHEYIVGNYSSEVDWTNINFWWGDERCVPPDDDDSNYKMANETLLKKLNVPEENVYRIKGENNPDEEAERYGKLISEHLHFHESFPQFDLILLGLGKDGHTASIFPDQMDLLNSEKICEVAVHPETGQKRVTLTGKVINNSKNIFFLITGGGKANVVYQIVDQWENFKSLPAAYIFPQHGKYKWFLDKAAASLI